MSAATCHLSSLKINAGDDVICIPVAYTEVSETSEFVYSSSPAACPIGMPLHGKYVDFGRFELDESSKEMADILCKKFKSNCMNDPFIAASIKSSKYHFGPEYYVFNQQENRSLPERGEFIADTEARKLMEDEGRLAPNLDLGDINVLLDLFHCGCIFDLSDARRVRRFGKILIRKDIYEAMLSEEDFMAFGNKVKENIADIMGMEDVSRDTMPFTVSKEMISSRVLLLQNNHDAVLDLSMVRKIHWAIQNKDADHSVLERSLLEYSLTMRLYSMLGKSFYPNAMRASTMKAIYHLNSIVNGYIDSKRSENIEECGPSSEWLDH